MTTVKTRSDARQPVNIPFSPEAYDDIQRIADQTGKTVERVILESLAVNRWVTEVQNQGGKVVGEKKGRRAELKLK